MFSVSSGRVRATYTSRPKPPVGARVPYTTIHPSSATLAVPHVMWSSVSSSALSATVSRRRAAPPSGTTKRVTDVPSNVNPQNPPCRLIVLVQTKARSIDRDQG